MTVPALINQCSAPRLSQPPYEVGFDRIGLDFGEEAEAIHSISVQIYSSGIRSAARLKATLCFEVGIHDETVTR